MPLLLILTGVGAVACDDAPDKADVAPGLFSHEAWIVEASAEAGVIPENGVLRHRQVSLNDTSLFSPKPAAKQTLTLNLFADVVISAELELTSSPDSRTVFYSGPVVGQETSLVTLMLSDQRVFLNVRVGGLFYRVRPDLDGFHRIEEISLVNLPGHHPKKSK